MPEVYAETWPGLLVNIRKNVLEGLGRAFIGSTCGLQGALGAMLVPGILLVLLGFVIYEPRLPRHLWYSGEVYSNLISTLTLFVFSFSSCIS